MNNVNEQISGKDSKGTKDEDRNFEKSIAGERGV